MKKKYYIFLTQCILGIGGMQLYLSRKIDYLRSIDWTVLVFYYQEGEILIPNLDEFKNNYIPTLRVAVGNVSKKERNTVIDIINKHIINYEAVIYESFTPSLGTWGEYLASLVSGKHILYLLNESISSPTKQMRDFLKYKIDQKLLFTIKSDVVVKWFPDIKDVTSIELKAVGCIANDVIDINNEVIDLIPEEGKTILSLGRLSKPYIKYLFECITHFANVYSTEKFNLVVVGDSPNENLKQRLFDIIKPVPNIRLFNMGSLWPLPKNIFEKSNIALGSAGSIRLCSRQGIPSVSIDANDFEAIGVLGYNTENTTFRGERDPHEKIEDWLKYILIENKIKKKQTLYENVDLDYSAHKKIIDEEFCKEYYPTQSSIYYVSHPHLRNLIIQIDQSKIGNKILKRILINKWIQAIVAFIYNKKSPSER